MEVGVLFQSIQDDLRDPAVLADEFTNAQFSIGEATLKLTQLLVYSCGIKQSIRETSISSENLDALSDFIDEISSKLCESAIPLNNSKFFKRCVSFFERIVTLDWNKFANGGNFDTLFVAVIDAFCLCELKQLHVVSFAIKLKLVTAFIRGSNVEVDENVMPKVKKYAAEMLKKAVFYRTVQCSILAAAELYEWIKRDDSFVTDENLRVVAWMLKMEKPKQICHGMLIAYSLLRMKHLQDKMTLFVRKLVSIFEDLCYTENNNIFDWICRCSELIYTYHREAISPDFENDLLDNLFAKDRQRAKSAAGFWMGATFDPVCHRSNFRTIFNYLEHVESKHWDVIVDSIIDDYPAIVDWKLLVNILLDEDDGVSEETRLTMTEKEKLLKLMSYAVEESVNGFPPEYRAENMKTLNLAVCHDFSCQVTDALVPVFWKLFHLQYTNKEHAQITLIHIAKFFNFAMIEQKTMVAFVQECASKFKTSQQAFCYQVVLDLLRLIVNSVRNTELIELCESLFDKLKKYCESQMIHLVNDFFKDPNKYTNMEAECVQTAQIILVRILALNRFMVLDRKVLVVIPTEMLQREMLPDNQVFLCILYVSVCLICENVIYSVKLLKQLYDEGKNLSDNCNDILDQIDFTIKNLTIRLVEWNFCSELSANTFFNLCKVLEAVRDLPMSQDMWSKVVPFDVQLTIVGYVACMVWKADDESGINSNVNEQTKIWIMNSFLNLIECKVLPLTQAYDLMTSMNKQPAIMEDPLRRFISNICASEEESTVVSWMLDWMIFLFKVSSNDCVNTVASFAELIYPIRKQMHNIIYELIRKGIGFALSRLQEGEESPVPRHQFLNVVVKLCEFLDDAQKTTIEEYFTANTFDKDNVKALKSFLRRMKKKPASKTEEKTTSKPKSVQVSSPILSFRRTSAATPDDNLSVWSASSINRSSSVLAAESDQDSMYFSGRPILMFRSDNDDTPSLANVMRAAVLIDEMSPLASSTPVNRLEALAKNTSARSGEVDELFQSLEMRSVEDDAMDISSAVSAISKNILSGLNNLHVTRPTELVDEAMSVSAAHPGTQTESTSQMLDTVSNLLKNQRSPTPDVCSVTKSPSIPDACDDISDVSKKGHATSPAISAYNVSSEVSPKSSASLKEPDTQSEKKSFDKILRELLIENPKALALEKLRDGLSNVEKKNNSQAISETQAYKNATNLLRSLESSSGEDYDMMKNSSVSESGEDSVAVDVVTPSAIPIDDLLNDPSSAENYDLMKNSSLSEFGEDGIDVITPPAIPIHGEPNEPSSAEKCDSGENDIDVIISPVIPFRDVVPNDLSSASSFTTKLLDTQFESASQVLQNINELLNNSQSPSGGNDARTENTAQAYDEVSKLLKSLDKPVNDDFGAARSPTVCESSEDNDDVFKNLQLESPPISTQAVENVTRDLFGESIEQEDANQKSGSSIIENLQRVSLSNAETETETETSVSSTLDFAKSPLKKKSRFEF